MLIDTFSRKRQNVYYVKIQENISTLNSEEDYFLNITSILGNETVSKSTYHLRIIVVKMITGYS